MQAESNVIAAIDKNGSETPTEPVLVQPNKQTAKKLPQKVIVKAPGLFPMWYKPSELAEDLDIPERTLRDWLADGAPCKRDECNHIWINGTLFAEWVEAQRKPKKAVKTAENEGYCFRCRKVMEMVNPHIGVVEGKRALMSGQCPICGSTINRGVSHD